MTLLIQLVGLVNIMSEKDKGEMILNKMKSNTDNGGTNLIIFDADDDFAERKKEILEWGKKSNVDFELFLFPDNSSSGALEELLELIINPKNVPIFDCWDNFEACIKSKKIEGRAIPLTIPAKKTKIYGYLETLLGSSKSEKERIKERERNYKEKTHWNLDSDSLKSLKEFLTKNIQN